MNYDTAFTDEIVCPWCGHEHDDLTDFYPREGELSAENECEGCGKPFRYTMDVSISWTTQKLTAAQELETPRLPRAAELTGRPTIWSPSKGRTEDDGVRTKGAQGS